MPKKPQPQSTQRAFSAKKFWIISLAIALLLGGVFVCKSLYDTYHDRPLVKELQYIGREYNSGCLPFKILCTSPETEYLYYATDTNPDEIVGLFPGWKVEKIGEENVPTPSNLGQARYYVLRSENNQESSGFAYFLNGSAIRADFKLLPTQKQYIISLDQSNYEKLHKTVR